MVHINASIKTKLQPVIETKNEGLGVAPQHRIFCPSTGENTVWDESLENVAAAWNAANPEPEPTVPPIPLVKK